MEECKYISENPQGNATWTEKYSTNMRRCYENSACGDDYPEMFDCIYACNDGPYPSLHLPVLKVSLVVLAFTAWFM